MGNFEESKEVSEWRVKTPEEIAANYANSYEEGIFELPKRGALPHGYEVFDGENRSGGEEKKRRAECEDRKKRLFDL